MRSLLFFTLGFGTACSINAYFGGLQWKLLLSAAWILGLCLISRKRYFWRKLLLAMLGCTMGFIWFAAFRGFYLDPVCSLDRRVLPLSIRAADYGEPGAYGTFFDGTVTLDGKIYSVQTFLNGAETVEPGDKKAGRYYLRVMETGVRPGQGVFLAAYQKGTVTTGKTQSRWWDDVARFRREIKAILQKTFPEDVEPFDRALFLGDTSGLSYEIDTAMKVSGVRHVVAVSGLHISILFGLLSTLTFHRRYLSALLGYPALFFFAALTGFTPSVVRSCLMWGLVLLAKLSNREYDGATALSFAVLAMLLLNPLVITAVGFQLSVASVAGIFLFRDPVFQWLRSFFMDVEAKTLRGFLIRWFTESVSITLGATVLTVPLCAYYFGMVSLVGVVTNLLALWVVSGIFYGIMAVCLLFAVLPSAASVLASVIAWPIRYVLWVAKTMAAFPLAAIYVSSPYILAWLIYVYVMLAVFLLMENRRTELFTCCAVLGLCLALTLEWVESITDDVRITVLDVGQGQSILLQSEGRSFLVDCGGDSNAEAADQAAEALLRQGIRQLDGLILTHLDKDHSGGAEELLSRIETNLLILPPDYSELTQHTDAQVICITENTEIAFGDALISIYPPFFPGNSNEKSLCVLFDTQKCDILITGDRDGYGERSLLRNAQIPDVDVLIAGHHGAISSTCEELLAAVKPEIVCISVGEGNTYGHPAPELLQRLKDYGCDIYRTDIQGTITIRR